MPAHHTGSADDGVTGWTERDHEVQAGDARHPMVDDDRALPPAGRSAGAAAVAIPLEHLLPQAAKILLVLALERVASGTHAQGEHFAPPAMAVQCSLHPRSELLHLPVPLMKSILLPSSIHCARRAAKLPGSGWLPALGGMCSLKNATGSSFASSRQGDRLRIGAGSLRSPGAVPDRARTAAG